MSPRRSGTLQPPDVGRPKTSISTTLQLGTLAIAIAAPSCGMSPASRVASAPHPPAASDTSPGAHAAERADPAPGAECPIEAKEVCLGSAQALACHGGRWEPMTCRGSRGCTKRASEDSCDQSVAEENDVCNLPGDLVCTADERAMLGCRNHRWTLDQRCLGDRKCVLAAMKVTCDNSLASVGDRCREEDDYACALPDRTSALACRGGAFVVAAHCRGPKACRIVGDQATGVGVQCDDSIASLGEACDKAEHYSCSADGRQIVKCDGRRIVADDKCKGREKCAIRGGTVGCYR